MKQRLEIERCKKRKGPEGLEESLLAKQFLHLWSLGKLSSTGLQAAANAATADGNNKPEIVELAQLGNFGVHPANCHRDLLRLLQQKLQKSKHGGLKESPINTVSVPCLDPKEENPNSTAECHLVLPHLLVSELFSAYPDLAPQVFGIDKLPFFWSNLKKDDPRMWGWGLKESQKKKMVPLWLHGDGVEFSTDSLLTFSFGPTLFAPIHGHKKSGEGLEESQHQEKAYPMDSSFITAAWPKSATREGTWVEIFQIMVWSFKALFEGRHPERNWKGEALPPKLQRLARKPLTSEEHQFFVFNFLGDLDYYCNVLGFRHWNCHDFCMLCDCSRKDKDKNPWDFRSNPGWTLKSKQGLKESPSSNHTLFQIPGGLPEYRISLDVLHTVDLGVAARILGSILHCWAYPNGQKEEGPSNIAKIWAACKKAYQELEIEEKFNNITLSMFEKGVLKGHAGEIRHFTPVLALVAWKKAKEKEEYAHMAECVNHLATFYAIIAEDDFFMTRSEEALQACRKAMCHYVWLKQFYNHDFLFKCTPKTHLFMHLAYMAKYQNPSCNWTYKQESFMGYVADLAHSCSHGTRACKLSKSLMNKYILSFQLRLNSIL